MILVIYMKIILTLLICFTHPFAVSFPVSNVREQRIITPASSVLIPPIIKYWASSTKFAQHNKTVKDDFGRPWFCTTFRQSHCKPLFEISNNFKTKTVPISKRILPILEPNRRIMEKDTNVPINTHIDDKNNHKQKL